MACQLSLQQLSAILETAPERFDPDAIATDVTTDTRQLRGGELFVALTGQRFDGHAFLAQAAQRGAAAAVVARPASVELPQFCVGDTLAAYQTLARWWRDRFAIPVIGITGSVGKTTTKELLVAALAQHGTVLKTAGNDNNEIGVPKTLLALDEHHDFAVIEMAMRGRGEIAQLARIARPTVGTIINVGTAHIGRLGSEAAIAEAKCELLAQLSPQQGLAVLNQDNARLMATAARVWQGPTLTYGLEGGDVCGTLVAGDEAIAVEGRQFPLPLPGRHNARNYLAALAVLRGLGLDWQPLAAGISVDLPGGRAQRYQLPGDIILLDETYNAGVESMVAALQLLRDTPGQRRIAVLGRMAELGERGPQLHARVGEAASELGLDALLVLADGAEARTLAAAADGIATECWPDRQSLLERLQGLLQPGDRVLLKASHSVGLGEVVAALRQPADSHR